MKIKNKLNKLISGFTAAVMCITMLPNLPNSSAANVGDIFRVSSETNKYIGVCNGYEHEVSIDVTGGNGSMTLGQNAYFNAEWSVSVPGGNFIARRGMQYGALRKATDYSYIRLDYEADFRQTGTGNEFGHSSLYVSGWFQNRGLDENVPLVKYYIIEDWVDWCPDASGKTVTIDGAQYKIFKMNYSGPTINNGFETYTRYYSVRQTKRTSGFITVTDHFEAWEKEGWDIGNLYDVNMCVEGYQSKGYADVDVNFYPGPIPDPVPQPQPEPDPVPDKNGHYINEKFESGTGDFVPRGGSLIEITSSVSNSGNKSLAVSEREDSWHGVEIELDPEFFKAGETYGFSVMAMQNKSSSENFSMALRYFTSDAPYDQYANIATAKGEKGEWVQLANPSFTIPDGAANLVLHINTDTEDAATTTDFFIDDFIIALENKIPVNEQPEKLIRGDLDNDGRISIFDLSLERNAIINSSSGDSYSPAADVDGDGMVAVNDLVLLSQYIHGKITKFPSAAPSTETASE